MPRTIQTPLPPMELNPLDARRPTRPAIDGDGRRAPHVGQEVNADQNELTRIVRDGLLEACGSLKAAAITMQMDGGQLTRELQDEGMRIGKLGKLAPTERTKVIDRLHERYGSPAQDPVEQLRREIRELRAKAEAVAQLAEKIA